MRSDGAEFPVELSITRGELFGRPFFTGYVRDLTERRRAEEERASLEAQLRQAQKMDAIGSLAGSITHDFNNILAVVNGYSELVLRRLGPDDPLPPADRGDRARGREGRRPHPAAARVHAPAGARAAGARPQRGRRRPRAAAPAHGRRPRRPRHAARARASSRVRADASQLEQVIMNLAVNARDAMPDGGTLTIETSFVTDGPALCVGRAVVAPEGPCALLSVADTGVGIEPGLEQRIFEPFFTTKAVGRGTGLGLSTVYGIVEQSGGCVWVDSAPGRGAIFNVCLPLAALPVAVPAPPHVDPTPDANHRHDPPRRGRRGPAPARRASCSSTTASRSGPRAAPRRRSSSSSTTATRSGS